MADTNSVLQILTFITVLLILTFCILVLVYAYKTVRLGINVLGNVDKFMASVTSEEIKNFITKLGDGDLISNVVQQTKTWLSEIVSDK